MKKLFLLLIILFQVALAQNYTFNSTGEKEANDILKNFLSEEFNIEDADVEGYLYDIDCDNQKEVIGIVKSNVFYSLEGYKLVVLKKDGDKYKPIKSDVFFDNTKEIKIDSKEIIYYKSEFYKNKKYRASIKNNEIKTFKSPQDKLTDKKIYHIEKLTSHTNNKNSNTIELSDFNTSVQKNVNIKYKNLNSKVKHYLDMK